MHVGPYIRKGKCGHACYPDKYNATLPYRPIALNSLRVTYQTAAETRYEQVPIFWIGDIFTVIYFSIVSLID